jgi:hypothetical protein
LPFLLANFATWQQGKKRAGGGVAKGQKQLRLGSFFHNHMAPRKLLDLEQAKPTDCVTSKPPQIGNEHTQESDNLKTIPKVGFFQKSTLEKNKDTIW